MFLDDDPVAHIPAVVWLAQPGEGDRRFTVRFVNEAAPALLGYPCEAWRSAPEFWIDITHAEDRARALRHLEDTVRSSAGGPLLVRWVHADGHALPVEVHLAAVTDERGSLVGLRGFALEASRWTRVQDDLVRTRELLAYASRRATLNELVASLVHELNQPLNAILNNAEAARIVLEAGAAEGADLAGLLDDIIAANERAGSIIRRASGLAKPCGAARRPVDLNTVVAEVCELLASDALLRGATLSPHLAPVPCLVAGDRVQLVQVLLNLAGNALDAVAGVAAGVREVDLAVVAGTGGSVEVAVVDSGHGIPAQLLGSVFEPLVSTKAGGLGLGLDIASSIVATHGGSTWAANNRDGGAHFVVAFPRA